MWFIYLAAPALSCRHVGLGPWPGIEPRPSALGVWSLSHCTTRETPWCFGLRDPASLGFPSIQLFAGWLLWLPYLLPPWCNVEGLMLEALEFDPWFFTLSHLHHSLSDVIRSQMHIPLNFSLVFAMSKGSLQLAYLTDIKVKPKPESRSSSSGRQAHLRWL